MGAVAEQFLQFIVNGVVTGGMLALPAIAFSVLFGILNFPNFAISAYITMGGFFAYALNVSLGLPMLLVFPLAMIVSGFMGVGVDHLAFRPMRGRRHLTLAIVSIGVAFILENIARFIWGNELRGYDLAITRAIKLGHIRIGKEQLVILLVSAAFMVLIQLLLKGTRMGKAMRAVADNPMLASVKGIDSEQVIRQVSFIGGALAGAAGIMVGVDTVIDPLMGFKLIFSVFAAAILGGLGSAPAAMGGAFCVGLAEEMSLTWIPATYKSAVGFSMIVIILLFRPQGLFSRK